MWYIITVSKADTLSKQYTFHMNIKTDERRFSFERFEERNVSTTDAVLFMSSAVAQERAKQVSLRPVVHHVIVSTTAGDTVQGFEEYERGELVSWSYQNGLGFIKANS